MKKKVGNLSSESNIAVVPEQPPEIKVSKRPRAQTTEIAAATAATKPRRRGKATAALAVRPEIADATSPLGLFVTPQDLDRTDPLLNVSNLIADRLAAYDHSLPSGPALTPRVLSCQGVECAYASDVGRVRKNNEDNLSAFMALVPGYGSDQELLFGFFVVADGMGGYEKGEVASQLAVRGVVTGAIEQIYLKAIAGQTLGGAGETPAETLVRIIDEANNVVAHQASRERNTMGTTLVCALLVGNVVYTGNIGDSRLYALRRDNGVLEQVTVDHSVVQRLVATGQLTLEEAAASPQRSMLYRSLGQPNAQPADTTFLRAEDFSHLLLCSDGLWDMVEDDIIAQILRESQTASIACRRLLNAANHGGGADNVSAIVVKLY